MKQKQIIILRKDLNMRKGKMVAQGSHASLCAYLHAPEWAQKEWLKEGQTKICVGVDSLEELMAIYEELKKWQLDPVLITDAGHTEFKGKATVTAVGCGPAPETDLDPITGNLKLL